MLDDVGRDGLIEENKIPMGMNVLVTGGAGYIGSATARLLLQQGHAVTVLDNLSRGHRGSVPVTARFTEGDLADTELLRRMFQEGEFDAVMHFAAFAEVGESMRLPELYFRNNAVNTCNLLEACLANKVSRFVLSSTCAVFGEPSVPASTSPRPRILRIHTVNQSFRLNVSLLGTERSTALDMQCYAISMLLERGIAMANIMTRNPT